MGLVSPEFALWCLLFLPVYWGLVRWPGAQKAWLIAAGYSLYMSWSPAFGGLLLGYSTVVWALGRGHGSDTGQQARPQRGARPWVIGLWLAGAFLLGCKYYELVRQTLHALWPVATQGWPLARWAVPVALSFITFQAIAYLVAVGRGALVARSWSDVVLFLCFWPTLFAGPIWRAPDFFAQRDAGECGRPQQVHRALYLVLLGLLQKLVLASWLAVQVVEPVYQMPAQHGPLSVAAAMVGYSLQIFFDFAGYTWLVTGMALLLGYRVPDNFLQPYLARNVQVFWTRWHVSLSGFIRDHLYIPMGGSRRGWGRTQLHVLLAMAISGLWHGAQWTFVLWGLLHGLAVVAWHLGQRWGMRPWPRWLAQGLTFAFVTVAWVFFRADDLPQALAVLQALTPSFAPTPASVPGWPVMGLLLALWWLSARADVLQARAVQALQEMGRLQLLCWLVLCMSLLIAWGPDGVPAFIYYRF